MAAQANSTDQTPRGSGTSGDSGTAVGLEAWFEGIVAMAAGACHTPCAVLAFADAEAVWFAAAFGCSAVAVPRAGSAWGAMLKAPERQHNFAVDPGAARAMGLTLPACARRLVGVTLRDDGAPALGVLAVLGDGSALDPRALNGLEALAQHVATELRLRRAYGDGAAGSPTPSAPRLLHPDDPVRTALEASPSAMLMIDADGRLVLLNAHAERLFGWRRDDLLGRPVEVLIPERYRARHPQLRSEFFAAPAIRPMGAGRDLTGLRKDGSEVPIEIGLSPIHTGGGTHVLAAIVDLTEHKRAEERLRAIVDAAPNAMLMVDARGRIALANAEAERLFAYPRADLIGRSVATLIPERFRAGHPAHLAAYFVEPTTRRMGAGRDLAGLRRDGSEMPIEIGLNPLRLGAETFVLASIIDITERKRTESAMRSSLAEKETLLREIHHRVKNNMQVISSLLRLQERSIADPRLLAVFRDSQDRLRAMGLIHEQLYAAADLGHIDFAEYLRTLIGLLRSTYAARVAGVVVELELEPLRFDMDACVPLGLIVHELVSNSFKHAFPDGRGGVLRVQLGRVDDQRCHLTVRDDGVGLPPGTDPLTTTSLGLRLVRMLAAQLAATFTIDAARGLTTRVSFVA